MASIYCFLVFGFFWLCDAQTTDSSVNGTEGCANNKADIVFLLDASYSEGETNFRKQLEFVSNFTQGYDIGPDKVQVGIVTFSTYPHNAFNLNTYHDKQLLLNGIKAVRYQAGALSTVVPYLDLIIALIGSSAAAFLALILPAFIEINTFNCSKLVWIKNGLIIFVGLAGFITGTFTTILKIVYRY